jgi:hypothetical protein
MAASPQREGELHWILVYPAIDGLEPFSAVECFFLKREKRGSPFMFVGLESCG